MSLARRQACWARAEARASGARGVPPRRRSERSRSCLVFVRREIEGLSTLETAVYEFHLSRCDRVVERTFARVAALREGAH